MKAELVKVNKNNELFNDVFILSMVADSKSEKKNLHKIRQGLEGMPYLARRISVGGEYYKYWVSTWVEARIGLWGKTTELLELNLVPWKREWDSPEENKQ